MALYNNGYPASYTPYYTQFAPVQVPQQTTNTNVQGGRIWVQGEAGAKSYLVAPNSVVDLWDSENPIIYQKSADAAGMPSIRVLDYTVRDSGKANNEVNVAINAQNGEIERINGEIEKIKTRLEKLMKQMKEDTDE